jgi:hypothetical protein
MDLIYARKMERINTRILFVPKFRSDCQYKYYTICHCHLNSKPTLSSQNLSNPFFMLLSSCLKLYAVWHCLMHTAFRSDRAMVTFALLYVHSCFLFISVQADKSKRYSSSVYWDTKQTVFFNSVCSKYVNENNVNNFFNPYTVHCCSVCTISQQMHYNNILQLLHVSTYVRHHQGAFFWVSCWVTLTLRRLTTYIYVVPHR